MAGLLDGQARAGAVLCLHFERNEHVLDLACFTTSSLVLFLVPTDFSERRFPREGLKKIIP